MHPYEVTIEYQQTEETPVFEFDCHVYPETAPSRIYDAWEHSSPGEPKDVQILEIRKEGQALEFKEKWHFIQANPKIIREVEEEAEAKAEEFASEYKIDKWERQRDALREEGRI